MKCFPILLFIVFLSYSNADAACISGNCWEGSGTYIYPSGAKYSGQFRGGKIHGEGVLFFSTGDVYRGEWKDHYREGHGQMTFKNGNRYKGSFWKNQFNGHGVMSYYTGDRYEGKWVKNQPNGAGKYFFKSGEKYVGNFKNGQFNGLGTMHYTDGARFEGTWKENKKHGNGTLIFTTGKKQSGTWTLGEFQKVEKERIQNNSNGASTWRNCNAVYCGSGRGVFTYTDGSEYRGEFKNGLPNGQGTLYYANDDKYVGGWRNHAPHGQGTMYMANGRVFGGLWEYGKIVNEREEESQIEIADNVATNYSEEVKVWAVVVGVGRYEHMPTLKYSDDDAYQVYAFLKSPEGGALRDEQMKILVDENATKANIIKQMQEVLLKADENDVVLFYFSGHGLEGSFLPVDYDGFHNKLRHEDLKQILSKSKAQHKLVLADACHSGSLMAMKAPYQKTIKKYYEAFQKATGGLALLMSSKSEEYSLEDGGLRSGIFSHFLIKGLNGQADFDKNQVVTISELYKFVFNKVKNYTAGAQTPTLSGNYDGDMPVAVARVP